MNTAYKIYLAGLASRMVVMMRKLLGQSSESVQTVRGNIVWQLNLHEGIDFSIYLLGGFEPRTLKQYKQWVHDDDIVLDIGANIGSHTLPLAQLVGSNGQVIAIEPTAFATAKLKQNLSLNPKLQERVHVVQAMLVDHDSYEIPSALFSSWPLENSSDLHKEHKGRLKTTEGAVALTLDALAATNQLSQINFIKLDVDGYEYSVLSGAKKSLTKFKPTLMMELAPYLHSEDEFSKLIEMLTQLGYCFINANTGSSMSNIATEIMRLIPNGSSMNIIAKVK